MDNSESRFASPIRGPPSNMGINVDLDHFSKFSKLGLNACKSQDFKTVGLVPLLRSKLFLDPLVVNVAVRHLDADGPNMNDSASMDLVSFGPVECCSIDHRDVATIRERLI